MKYKKIISFIILICIICGYVYYKHDLKNRQDITPPIIKYEGNLEVSIEATEKQMLEGVSAVDDIDGDVSNTLMIENIGKINKDDNVTITYAAYDKSNNVGKMTRVIHYTDYHEPKFSLEKPLIFSSVKENELFEIVRAVDAMKNDLSSRVRIQYQDTLNNMSKVEGAYPIVFTVTDRLGKTSSITLNMDIVSSKSNYDTSIINLKEYLIYVPTGSKLNLPSYILDITYQEKKQKINSNNLKIDTNLDTDVPGTYEAYYHYYFSNGVEGISKLVIIVE